MTRLIKLIAAAMFAMWTAPVFAGSDILSEVIIESSYEDARYDLEDAIISQGLTVDHISNVSNMLQRTAGAVDGARQIYVTGQQFQFCSASLSRNTMQADPANIVFCPYMIFMYQRVDEPDKIHVGFRRLNEIGSDESSKALKAVNDLLMAIITEAAGG